VKTGVAVLGFMAIGYAGLFSIGLSSSGRMDIVVSIAIACLFINLRAGIALAALNIIAFLVIAVMNVKGVISLDIDFNLYNHAARSWIAAFYNFTAMGIVVILANGLANQELRRYLKKIIERKNRLHIEISQRKTAEENYRKLSVTDPLTELFNRRYFFEKAKEEINRCVRYKRDLSFITADADNFKNINDTYGHLAGDSVLKELAARFKKILRPTDILCRMGGEEFCIILPETGIKEAVYAAERLRSSLDEQPVEFNGQSIRVTASFGASSRLENETDITGILQRADKAMYVSKNSGRNKVTAG
jgi:two-component system chemotaxis family response regulator WspR